MTSTPDLSPNAPGDQLLRSSFGGRGEGWRGRDKGVLTDRVFDLAQAVSPAFRRLTRAAATMPVRRVHVAGVDVPKHRADLEVVLQTLRDSRHVVTTTLAPLGDRGKFENINLALQDVDLSDVDWLIVTDDDIRFPPHFLDRFLWAAEAAKLGIAQPAHRFHSYTTWGLTQRRWNSLVRTTHFVECGPVTAFHRSVFPHIVPFAESRWAWGIDVLWGEIARRQGFPIGVVDATPIEHTRAVANAYSFDAAVAEGEQLLARHDVRRSNREILTTTGVFSRL